MGWGGWVRAWISGWVESGGLGLGLAARMDGG